MKISNLPWWLGGTVTTRVTYTHLTHWEARWKLLKIAWKWFWIPFVHWQRPITWEKIKMRFDFSLSYIAFILAFEYDSIYSLKKLCETVRNFAYEDLLERGFSKRRKIKEDDDATD